MSLYPSLEDMTVDKYQQAQRQEAFANQPPARRMSELGYGQYGLNYGGGVAAPAGYATAPAPADPYAQTHPEIPAEDLHAMYPSLSEEYMGIKLEPPTDPIPRPQYAVAVPPPAGSLQTASSGGSQSMMVAPLSSMSLGLARANVTHGVREVILCKDGKGKIGLRVRAIDKGIFIQFVHKDSPAALAGLRFGDQILQIDGKNVAGYSTEKALDALKKTNAQRITLAVRDRPFERTITLHKDSTGHVGFTFTDNEITNIAKDTSAARNGLLTGHHILEVEGQNVVGMNGKELHKVFDAVPQVLTITIMPSFLYKHIIKCMGDSLMSKMMDRSIPDV